MLTFARKLACIAAALIAAGHSLAQTGPTQVTGSARAVGMTPAHTIDISFSCAGEPTCTGTYSARFAEPGCVDSMVAGVQLTRLDLSRSGPVQGNITFKNFDWTPVTESCTLPPGSVYIDLTFAYTGSWDGSNGVIAFDYLDGMTLFRFAGSFKADRAAPPPVFPMTVASRIDSVRADATATIQYRPQDVGTTGSVFVFAVAPVTVVKELPGQKAAHYGHMSRGGPKDTPVQCVLAQLSSSGQLVGVSASSMQAYLTGVLTAGQQAVTILNGVPTVNIGGATFYVGYGTSATSMLNGGVNRSAITAPGTIQCKPEAPQTGWWWNTAEGGRGYSIEVRGHNIFFAAFHYHPSGRSMWHVATGPTSLDGSIYTGSSCAVASPSCLLQASGGQTLGGAYPGFPNISGLGPITLAFSDAAHGTMVWPGGVVAIERFNIVPNGLTTPPKAGQPENGWWWNPQEAGRGFFIEWQNGWADVAGYMYDDLGNPVWYLSVYPTPNLGFFSGNWWSYANGQSMMEPYKPATRISDNVAPVTITFDGLDNATMTLPNGRTTRLTRHRF